jgi:hypothetical protein
MILKRILKIMIWKVSLNHSHKNSLIFSQIFLCGKKMTKKLKSEIFHICDKPENFGYLSVISISGL